MTYKNVFEKDMDKIDTQLERIKYLKKKIKSLSELNEDNIANRNKDLASILESIKTNGGSPELVYSIIQGYKSEFDNSCNLNFFVHKLEQAEKLLLEKRRSISSIQNSIKEVLK